MKADATAAPKLPHLPKPQNRRLEFLQNRKVEMTNTNNLSPTLKFGSNMVFDSFDLPPYSPTSSPPVQPINIEISYKEDGDNFETSAESPGLKGGKEEMNEKPTPKRRSSLAPLKIP